MLATLAESEQPEGHTRWTMQLLVKRLVELKLVENISDETVRNNQHATVNWRFHNN